MIVDNHIDVAAGPDEVFALLNDVERVAGCLPGATLEGRDGDAYRGRVRFKVGPVSAAYAGTVRFTEVATGDRRLRLSARGADTHGGGDAEADVTLTVDSSAAGAAISVHTDLSVRGRIAQFGKGAISAVSARLLDQFAGNLVALLNTPPAGDAGEPARAVAGDGPAVQEPPALDGLAMLIPPGARRTAGAAAVAAAGFGAGWVLSRLRTQTVLIEELRHGKR